jgi:hypothetical protein
MTYIYIYERGVPGGALNLNSTGYPDHGRYGDLPLQRKFSTAEPGIKTGTSWLVARSSDHQATRLKQHLSIPSFWPAVSWRLDISSCCKMVVPDFLRHKDVTAICDAECQYVWMLFLIRQCLQLAINLSRLSSNILLPEHDTNNPLLLPIALL